MAVLLWSGCARTRPTVTDGLALPEGYPHHTAEQIQSFMTSLSEDIDAFRGEASITIDSPERSGRFSSEIRAREGDSLYLSISPGLGIEAVRVLVTQDSLYLYNRIDSRLTYGSLEEAGGLLDLPVAADDLYRNLIGITVPDPDIDWTVEAGDALYYLTDPTDSRHYTVDPTVWRVTRYEERSPSGELVEERIFDAFDLFGAWYLPREVIFRRPLDDATATLYYRSLDVNPGPLSFDLRVSSSAEREEVGQNR